MLCPSVHQKLLVSEPGGGLQDSGEGYEVWGEQAGRGHGSSQAAQAEGDHLFFKIREFHLSVFWGINPSGLKEVERKSKTVDFWEGRRLGRSCGEGTRD